MPLLENKNTVIYGAAGSMGGAIARAFAREGARVFLAGRTLGTLDEVANEIRSEGGDAQTAQVDALDLEDVEKHAREVVEHAGSIDVSVNAISLSPVQGIPLTEISLDDFMLPIMRAGRTHFLTATAQHAA
jgi:3-oxoacyl-[acyl-carrier protein] reductase